MKQIELNKGTISLPDDWLELNEHDRLKGFGWLAKLARGEMNPFEWQCYMFSLLTNYKPSRHRRTPEETANIRQNLVRLAESLNFAFTQEEDEDGNTTVRLNYNLTDCPVRCKTYFRRERIIDTNMTARQYADASEMLEAITKADDDEECCYYQDKLCMVLGVEQYDEKQLPAVRFAMQIWFTGVVLFWQQHPVYSILYDTIDQTPKDDTRVSLGLQEVILELTEKGYRDAADMLVTDFFDAQIKMLKDRLQEAKMSGVKLHELVKKTGIPLRNITRLI